MKDLAENLPEEEETRTVVNEVRRDKSKKASPWFSQLLAVLAVIGSSVAWAFTISGDLREVQARLLASEAASKRVETMVLENRVLTLVIAKELARKVDEAMPGPDTGLSGIDFAIQQAQADLERAK